MTCPSLTTNPFNVDMVASCTRLDSARAFAAVSAAFGASKPRRPRRPRNPTLASALKAAAKAGKSVKGAEVYPDRIVLQFGEPAPAEPDNPWPLDEFRRKETKE